MSDSLAAPKPAVYPSAPVPPGLVEVGARVGARIATLLADESTRWGAIDSSLVEPIEALAGLVAAGGKRLRPAFCHWAFVGAGGDPTDDRVVAAGAALEMLHTFALVHDDVMDGSDTRRGGPAIHRHFMDVHGARSYVGEARRFGEGAAILIGDFAFVWSSMLLGDVDAATRAVFDELRVELCVGQFLDLAVAAEGNADRTRSALVEQYKSGKYTVERPLHLGASLAGADPATIALLSAYGRPVGEAFQLRDDLLALYGAEAAIGKPVGDDLREGKRTPLIAVATERVTGSDATLLARLGAPDLTDGEVEAMITMLDRIGARSAIEARIAALVDDATTVLVDAPLTTDAREALAAMARYIAWRDA